MFNPIDIKSFVYKIVKTNKDISRTDFEKSLKKAVADKKMGVKCHCGTSIWAIGSAVVGSNMCFSCITGEADNSEDYEIDEVC